MEKAKPKPVHTGELGTLQYAIWENQSQNGKRRLNVEFSRSYQNQDGWQTEKFRLRHHEVVLLSHLVVRCIHDLDAHATDDSVESNSSSTA